MAKESLILIPPKEEVLKPYIKLYYFHSTEEKHFNQKITYYPNYTTTLNIYKNSKLTWDHFSRTHTFSEEKNYLSILVGKFNLSREIIMLGPFNKFSIVFHPLGLNQFVQEPLSNFIAEHFSLVDPFSEELTSLFPLLFSKESAESKRDSLDQFFLQKFNPFKEERLSQAVIHILEAEEPLRVSQMAQRIGISRKTLLRLFQKHLSYSVEEYLSVVKFRKALIQYQQKEEKPNLIEVAYDQNYYDQADFNRQIKFRSGQSPRQLFKELHTIQKGLYWKLSS